MAVAAEAVVDSRPDRVGIGWRDSLAAGIVANRDSIDIVEIIAEDYYGASRAKLSALNRLAEYFPVSVHGVAMGLASTIPVSPDRVKKMARLVASLRPDSWSEHLAFVRAGGVEIGHLAAPPRSPASVQGAISNIKRAQQTVGCAPMLENIATLIDPPASTMDEAQWVSDIIRATDAGLLLDLHNLYANACNFGTDPVALLLRFPLERVRLIHISGGKWITHPADPLRKRLLDDHLHDVPSAVHDLLAIVAQRVPQPLTVVLERDGHFPQFDHLLAELNLAREALQRGRRLSNTMRDVA